MKPVDLIGTHWRQEAEETPYRAQNTRMNVETQIHEVGLKRIDTGDTPGVGYIWIDPEKLVRNEEGWIAADKEAQEAVAKFGPVKATNVMLEAAVEAVKQASLTRERDPRLASLTLGELVNRGAAYVLEIEAHFTGNVEAPAPVTPQPDEVQPLADAPESALADTPLTAADHAAGEEAAALANGEPEPELLPGQPVYPAGHPRAGEPVPPTVTPAAEPEAADAPPPGP